MMRLKSILEGVLVAVMLMTACLGARCEVVCSLPHGCEHAAPAVAMSGGCGMPGMAAVTSRAMKVTATPRACAAVAARVDAEVQDQRQEMVAVHATAVGLAVMAPAPMVDGRRWVWVVDSGVFGLRPLERSSALRV